jgi:hypothetical protein
LLLLAWAVTVVVAAGPLLIAAVSVTIAGTSPNFVKLCGRGELFIVASAICAGSIGDLIVTAKPEALRRTKVLLGILAGFTAAYCFTVYALIYARLSIGAVIDEREIANQSVVILIASVIIAVASRIVGSRRTG